MSFDDFDLDNPVSGLGNEMLPERGMPFEDDDLESAMDDGVITPEELDALMAEDVDERDGGMNAGFPMVDDDPFAGLPPLPEEGLPVPGVVTHIEVGGGEETLLRFAPGLGSTSTIEGTHSLESAEDLLNKFVTDDRMQSMWDRIDLAQKKVREDVPNLDIGRELLDQLERARNDFLADRDNYEEVERIVSEVEFRIIVIARSIEQGPIATRLFVYELVWSIVLLGLMLAMRLISSFQLAEDLVMIIFSAGIGGLGGIVSAMFALWRHTAQEVNFSKQYNMWYITNPIIGIFLGVFVYLVMRAGVLSIVGQSGADGNIVFPYTIYLLAFITGFQQNVAIDLIRRLKNVFFPDEPSNSSK